MNAPSPGRRRPRLNPAGRFVVAAVFLAGVLVCTWLGWLAGAVRGLENATAVYAAPAPPGVGLAPNIGPAVGGVVEIGAGALLGVGLGLAGGIAVMALACRYLVAPVARRVRPLTAARDGGGPSAG
jgi:hypothetical protein